jgi:hypothetical protein
MVDINPAVTNFNSLLASIIKVSESPQDAIHRLTTVENGWDRFYENIGLAGCPNGGVNFYDKLKEEAGVYGEDHWTHPDRFAKTRAALIEAPPTFVSADITSPNFAAALNELTAGVGTDIGFANMTNVHRWIRPKFRVADFIEKWPMNDGALMMYSEFFHSISALEMAIASKQQYLDIAPRRVDNLISLMAGRAISYGAAALDANG